MASVVETEKIMNKGFLSHDDPLFWHGRGYTGPTDKPSCTWRCKAPPRDDHDRPSWLTASEFEDTEPVQCNKVKELARLIMASKKTVLYTGAGISASVIGQAARSGQNKVGWKSNPREAKPTPTHYALGVLGRHGLVHSWVQQNHDGLPQKAGFPQELINEVHGSWFNPANPVVKYSGNLHTPCYEQMLDDASTADLVIVLGTSLGGLNADQVATRAADRSLKPSKDGSGRPRSLGSVCINLQQTPHDGKMTLRLFGKSDDYLGLLLSELGLSTNPSHPASRSVTTKCHWPSESRVLVPYDKHGKLLRSWKQKKYVDKLGEDSACENEHESNCAEEPLMWLDLQNNSHIKLVSGHNCVGSGQPSFKHITNGRGRVIRREEAYSAFVLEIEGATMKLGFWWLDSALRGAVEELPVVNLKPEFQNSNDSSTKVTSKSKLPSIPKFNSNMKKTKGTHSHENKK